MEITQDMKETMILSLLRHDKTPQGVECSFFQFGTVGVKFYGYGREAVDRAEQAFEQQSRCYEAGLAPKPGELFGFALKAAGKDHEGLRLYGYTTEVAIVDPNYPTLDDDRADLICELHAAGLPDGDLHGRNVGYVVDEETDDFKLVPIDFGEHFAGF